MSSNSELFRNDLYLHLTGKLTPDQLRDVLAAVDLTASSYEITRKKLDLVPASGIPEVVRWYLASKSIENVSIGTLNQYRYKLINFFSAVRKPFQDITPADIRLYLYGYKQARSVGDHTVDNTRRVLNSFFTWLLDNEYILRNPMAQIQRIRYTPAQRVPLTSYELEVLRWNCADLREKALLDFLFSTGCRVSECSSVDLDDICWTDRSVIIRHGKGDKPRTVFFNAESELSLRKYLETRDDRDPALFVGVRSPHNRLSPRAIELIIKKISTRSSVSAFPHKLRHTFATAGLRGGMPLERLQQLMGHSKPETTLIYAKLDRTDLQREHQRVYA